MYTGILNCPESGIVQQYKISAFNPQDGEIMFPIEGRNPFAAERLSAGGLDLMGQPLVLTWTPDRKCFLERVVLRFTDTSFEKIEVLTGGRRINTYRAETGAKARRDKVEILTVTESKGTVCIRIYAGLSDINIEGVEIYGCVTDDIPALYPEAGKVVRKKGYFNPDTICGVEAPSREYTHVAAYMVLTAAGPLGLWRCMRDDHGSGISLLPDENIPKDGFRLKITSEKITVRASTMPGFFMASHRIGAIKALNDCSKGIPCCEIEDAPFRPFRGVHLFLPGPDQLEFTKNLIRYCICPMGYNYIIFEFAGGMYYESHPEITKAVIKAKKAAKEGKLPGFPHGGSGGDSALTHAQVRELVEFVRSFGMEVIPEVQSLSHVQYMTWAHPEIAEIPEGGQAYTANDPRLSDAPPSEVYRHSYCPSCEESYKITLDLLEEIIDVVEPREYVHMGHDEVYQIGVCPKCRGKDPSELFYGDVMRYYSFLREKGLKMIIWADMVQPASKYATRPALEKLPKDIVLMDFIWYFHPDKDIEDGLLEKGFEVVYGNMYSSYFSRFESRIRKPGISGGEVSAWVPTNEEQLGREGKIYDIIYTGNQLWSGNYLPECRYCYDRSIRKLITGIRRNLSGSHIRGSCMYASKIIKLKDRINRESEIRIDHTFDRLRFAHTVELPFYRTPWEDLPEICEFTLHYTDGSTEIIPVKIGMQTGSSDRLQNEPLCDKYYRHNGYISSYFCDSESKMVDGTVETVYFYEWENPFPKKKAEKLTYRYCCAMAEYYRLDSVEWFKKK